MRDNYYEDWKWNADRKPAGYSMALTILSSYVNDYDGYMDFQCTEGKVITGISAIHDNCTNSRRYKVSCSYLNNCKRGSCLWISYTTYDACWNELTPTGKFLVGMNVEVL